eukprot:3108380-Alexandrium_andersonii.AAC.1
MKYCCPRGAACQATARQRIPRSRLQRRHLATPAFSERAGALFRTTPRRTSLVGAAPCSSHTLAT